VDRRDALVAVILFSLAVPIQYWLRRAEGGVEPVTGVASEEGWSLRSLVVVIRGTIKSVSEWLEWLDDLASDLERGVADGEEPEDGVRMVVGLKEPGGQFQNGTLEEEYFGTSNKPRRKRPSEVLYRVGQVVFHRDLEVRGVVMGWDSQAKAPFNWLKQVYGVSESDIFLEPHYTVICDVKQIPGVENEVHYFAQSQMDDDSVGGKVVNPLLEQIFKGFDEKSGRYILSAQLRKLYPKD